MVDDVWISSKTHYPTLGASQDKGHPCGFFDTRWGQPGDHQRIGLLCDHTEGVLEGFRNLLSIMDHSWASLYGETGPPSYPREQWVAHAPTLGITQPTITHSGQLYTGAQRGADRRYLAPDPHSSTTTGLPGPIRIRIDDEGRGSCRRDPSRSLRPRARVHR